jgi:hypothetical protein
MTRHQPYHPMNPHPGISPAHETATGHCYASPSGDGRAIWHPRLRDEDPRLRDAGDYSSKFRKMIPIRSSKASRVA